METANPLLSLPKNKQGLVFGMLAAALFLFAGTPAAHAQMPMPAPGSDAPVSALSQADWPALVARARGLLREQQFERALVDLRAAYALRQAPWLLFEIAHAQESLGMAAEAEASYRRYLIAEKDETQPQRTVAEQALWRLGVFRPAAAQAAPREQSEAPVHIELRKPHRGLVAAGWTLLSIGYTAAFAAGIGTGIAWSFRSPSYYGGGYSSPHSGTAYTLLIPVIGPLVSAIAAPATAGSNGDTYALVWSLPWLLVDLPFQVIGLGLIIQGYRTPEYRIVPNKSAMNLLSQVQVRPYSTGNGGGLTVSGKF